MVETKTNTFTLTETPMSFHQELFLDGGKDPACWEIIFNDEETEADLEAFEKIKNIFNLELPIAENAQAVESSHFVRGNIADKEVTYEATLFNKMTSFNGSETRPVEHLVVTEKKNNGEERRWVLNESGVISFNSNYSLFMDGDFIELLNPSYPIDGWQDVETENDKVGFRKMIFGLEDSLSKLISEDK